MSSCHDGSHAVEIIVSAVDRNAAWIALSEGRDAIEWCARGNFASVGLFFEQIGRAIVTMADEEPPEGCRLCAAHVKAARAAMEVWGRSMRESGFTKQGKCDG